MTTTAPLTPREIDAGIAAAKIRSEWMDANPPPIRRTGPDARIFRAELAAYKLRWQASPEFAECDRVTKEGSV